MRNGGLSYGGGIICVLSSSPTILNNNITENSAVFGGGIYCDTSCNPLIIGNTFTGNSALNGGAIFCEASSPTISGNTFKGNSADRGGAIFCGKDCLSEISNNIMIGNSATTSGGGILCDWNASPHIVNNIIVNSLDGEGIFCGDETWPTISYNDIWNNADGDVHGGRPGVRDTTWGNNYNGTPCDSFYNIVRDPMFDDTLNYTLLCSSACIDAGDPTLEVPDGGGRRIDIGISEYWYTMGDVNDDGEIGLSDAVSLINCVLLSDICPCPLGEGDVNCNGFMDMPDIVHLINYLFRGGPEPGCY